MRSENSTAQIRCTSDSTMYFYQSQSIHITNLEFIGCGGNQVGHVEEFVVKDTKFIGQENSETALEFIETTVQIVNSTFLSNRKGLFRECDPGFCGFDGFIGGAIIATNSTVEISQSIFEDNGAADTGGAILAEQDSIINMSGNVFVSNEASYGGVLYSDSSTISIEASNFFDNSATNWGGVLYSRSSTITIEASEFHNNSASFAGVLGSDNSTITIEGSGFHDNSDSNLGGVLGSIGSNITIEASELHDNSAGEGGVLHSYSSAITIEASKFYDNSANNMGGVLASIRSNIIIEASGFHDNDATIRGGVLYSASSNIKIAGSNFTNNVSPIGAIIDAASRSMIQHIHSFLLVDNNKADRYAVIYLSDSEFIGNDSGNAAFSSNLGSLVAFNSNITFTGYATFVNNTPSQTVSGDFQEGGAITLFQSNIFFDGDCNLEHNHAENGGAIHSTESRLYVNGDVNIAHNTATGNGGGVYLSTSELYCRQKSTISLWNNTSSHKGGGIHAIGSPIKAASSNIDQLPFVYTGARINITGNSAERGGGLSLEANAKLYILKYYVNKYYGVNTATFTANSADYGGAIHVDDDTNSGTCGSSTETECFFQVLALHSDDFPNRIQSMLFSKNYANISGSTLYGGLLDRCAVSPFAEVHNKYPFYDFRE